MAQFVETIFNDSICRSRISMPKPARATSGHKPSHEPVGRHKLGDPRDDVPGIRLQV